MASAARPLALLYFTIVDEKLGSAAFDATDPQHWNKYFGSNFAGQVMFALESQIKADPALKSIPIVAVTSYALSGDEEKTRAAGCDSYIAKPYSPRQMLAKVREILGA